MTKFCCCATRASTRVQAVSLIIEGGAPWARGESVPEEEEEEEEEDDDVASLMAPSASSPRWLRIAERRIWFSAWGNQGRWRGEISNLGRTSQGVWMGEGKRAKESSTCHGLCLSDHDHRTI
jgi:hypothetical protein